VSTAKVQLQLVDVLRQPLNERSMLIELFSNESSKTIPGARSSQWRQQRNYQS
jgi:hypothetical protein